jgi:hypothetical protein
MNPLKKWNKGTVEKIAATKQAFLMSSWEIELSPDFDSVLIVLIRLQELFVEFQYLKQLHGNARLVAAMNLPVLRIHEDAETLPYVTLERFREALGARNDQAV